MKNTQRLPGFIFILIAALVCASVTSSLAATVTYTYDPLNRLVGERYEDGTVVAYSYDEVGNRLALNISRSYIITVAASSGGTVSPSGSVTVEHGGSVTFTITPDANYLIADVKKDGQSVGVVSTYTFTSVAANHTLEAVFVPDTEPPAGSISINSGSAATNTTSVTLSLTCGDNISCSQMVLSNDTATWTAPEALVLSKPWTLMSGDGLKTAYVKLADPAGNWSGAYSDSIVLDTIAPVTTASPSGGTYSTTQSVTLSCSDGSGSGCASIYYTTDGSTPTTLSSLYAGPISITTTTTLKYFALDQAGNSEVVKSETYTISAASTSCWMSVALSDDSMVAVRTDGSLWQWGWSSNGYAAPQQIGTDTDWAGVSGGEFNFLAIKTNGARWGWGMNFYGVLGDGTYTERPVPIQIGTDATWTTVAVGAYHTAALKADGSLWAWGYNNYGEVGDGTRTREPKLSPVRIGTDSDWVAVAVGGFHTVALKVDGSLWAWGSNGQGQLGDGTTTHRFSPTRIGSENTWVSIAAGGTYTAAVKADGTLWAWGGTTCGESTPGVGDLCNLTPTRVGVEADWASVRAGDQHTMVLKANGTLWAWGWNDSGELGDGTLVNRYAPVQIGGNSIWVSSAPGLTRTAAIKTDGTLWVWGGGVDKLSPAQITTP